MTRLITAIKDTTGRSIYNYYKQTHHLSGSIYKKKPYNAIENPWLESSSSYFSCREPADTLKKNED